MPQLNDTQFGPATGWSQGYNSTTTFSNGATGESSLEVHEQKGRFHADAAVFHDTPDGDLEDHRAMADYGTKKRAQVAAEGMESRITAGKRLPKRVDSYSR